MLDTELNKWFISPRGENQAYIYDYFSNIIEQLTKVLGNASERVLIPKPTRDVSLIDNLNKEHSLDEVLDKLMVLYNSSMNASSDGYIGQMDSIPNIGAIAGDLVTAAINNNMLAHEMSPVLSWLEQQLVTRFCQWFGFGAQSGGIMTSGGTLANLQALTLARNVKLELESGNLLRLEK
ncbi:hypothetical protein BKI52_11040 [marine bacterium AO1-C]|nr:hypothetical protein BKI52_11040 [marine bacterium AO1-C]